MSSVKVVSVGGFFKGAEAHTYEINHLKALGIDLVLTEARTEDEIIAAGRDANILAVEGPARITRRVIETLDDCWLIAKYAIGFDTIDIEAATEHRIVVSNAAGFCVEEVSDHAAALLLACARRLVTMDRHVQTGEWQGLHFDPPIRRTSGLTLGLVAFGAIARLVAQKMRGFNMCIIASDPYVSAEVAADYGVELVPLAQLLRDSDLISIHTLLNAETRHLIGETELRAMKPTAFLVNTSRGPVIDEAALVRALKEGWIAGAALDVTEIEPLPADSPLRGMPNVVLTPHHAAVSVEAMEDLHRIVTECISAVAQGYWPPTPVNPDVKPRIDLKPYAEYAGPS